MADGDTDAREGKAPSREQTEGHDPNLVLAISYRALRRARHTIEDFVLSYFPYHGLDPLKEFLRWWDVLVYVEGAIYQLDEENERLSAKGITEFSLEQSPAGAALVGVLLHKGLWTNELRLEMNTGFDYWGNERRLCARMLNSPTVPPGGHTPGFTLEEVHTTSKGKSFDYRLLNLLLFALRRAAPEASLLEFLAVDEHLVDIGDDLVDYEDDVARNSFNIYRCYVHLYGLGAQLKLVEHISQHEACHAELLQRLPEQVQQQFRRRQREAAPSDAALRWSFPHPVLDERQFREEHAAGSTSDDSDD